MTDWAEDFSYDYYVRILETLAKNFFMERISDAELILSKPVLHPTCFLRHDVDVSIEDALIMANIEKELGIKSTYYIRTNSKFYNLKKCNAEVIREIQKLGHEIGLHYYPIQDVDVFSCCGKLEAITGKSVRTISFHMPEVKHMKMGLRYCGLINTYSEKLREWYITDSSCRWRDGEPLPQLQNPKKNLLQIVTHPIWWGDKTVDQGWKDHIIKEIRKGM